MRIRSEQKLVPGKRIRCRPNKYNLHVEPVKDPGRDYRDAKSIREWAYRTGLMPQVLLLHVVRGKIIDGYEPTFKDRVDAAKTCLPYFAPRLSAVEVTGEDGGPVQTSELFIDTEKLKEFSDEELSALERAVGRLQTGTRTNPYRETITDKAETFEKTIFDDDE